MLTWLEIDSRAIQHNLRQFKKLLKGRALLMPVIKSNAYGHGFLTVAKICHNSPEVDRICVVNLDEALELIKNKLTKKPILVLSFFDKDKNKLTLAIKSKVIFPLYNLEDAKLLNKIGDRIKKKIKVHIKVDTGMCRLGVLPNQVLNFVRQIKKLKWLDLEGLWSHFSSSEDDYNYTKLQHTVLNQVDTDLKKHGFFIPLKHIANSAAITTRKFTYENAVRLGRCMYGIYPNENKKIKLKPALSWHTTIIQIKTVPPGAKIGYNGTINTKKSTQIAILPVGYFDGYDRRLSNNGYVLIKGKHCPILGTICMNMCMVDISGLAVTVGDTATLIGKNKAETILLNNMASWCHTNNYEIIARINPLLPRIEKSL